jgi:hypothetical protein
MLAIKPTCAALAVSAACIASAHAGINVPVTQKCDSSRAATAYVAGSTNSSAILPFLVGPSRMTPCYIETDLGSSEPSLTIRKDGTVVYAPVHFPNGDIGVMRSKDNGSTWDATVPRLPDGSPHNRVQPSMFMEPQTEKLFFASSRASFTPLHLETGMNLSISDDGGDTWHYKLLNEFKGIDWIKYAAGPAKTSTPVGFPKVMYISGPTPISTPAVIVVPKAQQVLKSLDGGETWAEAGSFDIMLTSNGCPLTEYILMGSSTVTPDGTVYIAGRRCKKVVVAKSLDEGETWTVTDVPNTKLITGLTTVAIPLNPNFVLTQPITSDAQGNLYVLYTDEKDLLRLTYSRNKGATWSQPMVISAPTVKGAHLTSLTVKAPGQIAIAYYGTEDGGVSGNRYNAYVAESTNVFSLLPAFKSQVVNKPTDFMNANGFDTNYIGMFFGGDLSEITQIQYAPNGDLFVSLVKDMCPNGISKCTWDFDAHLKSKFQAIVGRITH